ncbi:MAG: hypothetical protein KGN01_05310 [Patescibacteria group bacterium]|nr:hypothetical protein [Patescibacteria group bacterium]
MNDNQATAFSIILLIVVFCVLSGVFIIGYAVGHHKGAMYQAMLDERIITDLKTEVLYERAKH